MNTCEVGWEYALSTSSKFTYCKVTCENGVPRIGEHGVPRMGENGVPRMGKNGVPRMDEHGVPRMITKYLNG